MARPSDRWRRSERTRTNMAKKILALDIGDRKSVCGVQSAPKASIWRHTVPTSRQAIHDLIATTDPDLVVLEAGSAMCWVHDIATALGAECVVTATIGEQWRSRRNKSDRIDVDLMLRLARVEDLQPVLVPDPPMREWRGLMRHRQRLVRNRTRSQNRVRGLYRRLGLPMPDTRTAWSREFVAALAADSKPLAECGATELWRGVLHQELATLAHLHPLIAAAERTLDAVAKDHPAIAVLKEDSCMGPRSAEAMVACLVDPLRFARGKQVSAFVGLTPRRWQSGATDRDGRISRQGDSLLRGLLVEIAWLEIRNHESWAYALYTRVRKGVKKRSKIAIVAVARHLLVRQWAKWRNWELARRAAAGAARGSARI